MSKIDLIKKIRGNSTYSNAINSSFTELIPNVPPETQVNVTVEEFFVNYEQLFFDIPPNGEENSHEYLIKRSTEYLGGSIFDAEKAALIEEINSLRQQLLDIGDTFLATNNLT